MTEEKIKHLTFVQNVITRMNTNSFQIKAFTVTIAAAVSALYVATMSAWFFIIPIFTTLSFCFLDTYYLQQERKFRGLYDALISDGDAQIKPFAMPIRQFTGGDCCYWKVLCSKTILIFYGIILILLCGALAITALWIN